MSRWAKQVTRVGRDGIQLAQAIFKDSTAKRAVSFKPVLLDQARQSNSVAHSLLQIDRQIGLVKYYGILCYFKQQWQARFSSSLPPSTTPTTSDGKSSYSTTSETSSAGDPIKARIAFMITGSMKQELNEQLGYDLEEDIKKMTPLQASLILHYRITADEMEEKLPLVEAEYEKKIEDDAFMQQQAAAQREKFQAARLTEMKKEEDLRKAQQQQQEETSQEPTTDRVTHETVPTPLSYSSITENADEFQSSNLLESSSSDAQNYGFFGESWFEVIETNPTTGESSRVGLYLDEEEATLGLQTRQEIAERRGTDLTFALKPVEKSDIFSPKQG